MEGYRSDSYGNAYADVYDDWYADVSDVDATVSAVVELAAGGAVLELGVGTGRLAIPLARAGLNVTGIDASTAMLDRLRQKPGSETVSVTAGDIAGELPSGSFAVVLCAFNTLFNLTTAEEQARCIDGAASRLAASGTLVIEAIVPDLNPDTPDAQIVPRSVEADRVVLTISIRDRTSQTVSGQHVEVSADGSILRPWSIRYLSPAQIDELVAASGLELVERWADWSGTAFTGETDRHISLYRRASS